MPSNISRLPDWEQVLSSAAHLQRILPDAVLVGGTASAIYAGHRISTDADHVLTDLRSRFAQVLADLESVSGWKTARIRPPVQILGSLDGIETGVRQLIRERPLETSQLEHGGEQLTVPTLGEMLRIKGGTVEALRNFDELYPQPNGESALQQLQIQLAAPLPFDLEGVDLGEYKLLAPEWQDWERVRAACMNCAVMIFDHINNA